MLFIKTSIPAAAILMTLASSSYAQKAGDNVLGVGIAKISPAVSLGQLDSVGPAAAPFNAANAGGSASSNSATTLSVSWLHMFTENVATELSLGIPPKLDLDVPLTSRDHPGAANAHILTLT